MKFLRSRYVLILLLTILVAEGAFRLGFYEPLVNPTSHSGTTITLVRALRQFGTENVDVVTLGDSRAVQGLNNQLIFETAQRYGLVHVRMSMPGSQLLTLETLSAWTLDELPALQGIVLALSPASFGTLRPGAYELAKVLPIRNKTSTREILHHVPFDRSDIRTFAAFSSVAGYRDDIKNLLSEPLQRRKALLWRNAAPPLDFLTYNGRRKEDICAVATEDSLACLDELERRRSEIAPKTWRVLDSLCRAAGRSVKEIAPGEEEEALIKEWTDLLEKLSQKLRVMVVLLPDHSIYQDKLYARNATWVMNRILGSLQQKGVIELVDLRTLIIEQDNKECSYFMDAKHLNNLGKEVLTRALLPTMEKFWGQLEKPLVQ